MNDVIAHHHLFEGRVQGVGFRLSLQRACLRHGVRGWVRNLKDGRVEAVCEGTASQLEAALQDVNARLGDNIEHTETTPTSSPQVDGFEIRR